MAREDLPSVCTPCVPAIISCCPTLGSGGSVSATYSNANAPNASADASRSGCGFAFSNFDDYLEGNLIWTSYSDDKPHIGVWVAYWDDYGIADQYYSAEGSTDWCNPSGTYSASCDDFLCEEPSDTSTLTVSISADTNAAPNIASIPTQINTVGDTISLQVFATDQDAGQTLRYSAVGLSWGLTIDSATGLITGNIVAENVSNELNVVTVTVTDNATNPRSASTTFGWFARINNP
jgi:hypothetical protein